MGKRGPGAKKFEPDWSEFDKLCAIQCTMPELEAYYGVSRDSIERAVKRKHKKCFADYFAQKRKHGFVSLRRITWQKALGGDKTMIIVLWKKYLGFVDKVVVDPKDNDSKESSKQVTEALDKFGEMLKEISAAKEPKDEEKKMGLLAASLGLRD